MNTLAFTGLAIAAALTLGGCAQGVTESYSSVDTQATNHDDPAARGDFVSRMDLTPADMFPWRDYLTEDQAVDIATAACTRMDETSKWEAWTSIVRDFEEQGVPWLYTSEAIHLGSGVYCPEHSDALQTDFAQNFDMDAWMASPGNHPELPPFPFVVDQETGELVPNPEHNTNTAPAVVDEYIEDAEPGNSEIVARMAREFAEEAFMQQVQSMDPYGSISDEAAIAEGWTVCTAMDRQGVAGGIQEHRWDALGRGIPAATVDAIHYAAVDNLCSTHWEVFYDLIHNASLMDYA